MKKIVLSILVIGIIAGGYVWFFIYNKSHRDYHSEDLKFQGNTEQLKSTFFLKNGSIDSSLIDVMIEVSGEITEMESTSIILDEICIVHLTEGETIPESGNIIVRGRLHGVQDDIIYGELIAIDHAKPL